MNKLSHFESGQNQDIPVYPVIAERADIPELPDIKTKSNNSSFNYSWNL